MASLREVSLALALALRQLTDRRLLGMLLLALAIAAMATGPFLLMFALLFGFLDLILPDSLTLPLLGRVDFPGMFSDGIFSGTAWLFWTYLISPLAVAIIGALLDPIVAAVEARHYPNLPQVRHRGPLATVGYAIRFLFLMLGISLVAWIVAWLTPVPASVVFVLASGYLISREYFETVAVRRVSDKNAKRAVHAHLPTVWLVGCLVALALNLPVVNLIAPIVGVAAFTHLFHRLRHSRAD
ncbi:MAG: EI24 domain-containing protein [Rhodobacter sp.]|nr:EI24 domain-containing protein [Rhodobacter sp.]MCY4169781.1 EI24 domain-containing protein [Rhodobacter sp.]